MMNPNARASPFEPYNANVDSEGGGSYLQGTSSQYHHPYASSSQIHNPNFIPAEQLYYYGGLSNPHPSPLSPHPTNFSIYPNFITEGTNASFDTYMGNQYLFGNSSPAASGHIVCDSPLGANVLFNSIPFSPQGSDLSDPHQSSDYSNKCPISGAYGANKSSELKGKQVISVLAPDSDIVDSSQLLQYPQTTKRTAAMMPTWDWDLADVFMSCLQALSDGDITSARVWMDNVLETMVSVSGEPIQRLGAYLLLGLRARSGLSRNLINKALKWKQPTSNELLTYKNMLYQICPYLKFAYISANEVIREAMKNESRIHIIDFQIGQGFQWNALILALAVRPGASPFIRMTGIDDSYSCHARGGGLDIVGQQLSDFAESLGVQFEFHCSIKYGRHVAGNDLLRPGEALAVSFPYSLCSIQDESVSRENRRDGLLRFVKSLSPKVVTLAEIESNTNTSSFHSRFLEIMNYYTAVFESIDVAWPRNDMQRIGMERQCLGGEILNTLVCDGHERVNRHELLAKWRSRFAMAGFTPCPLSPSVAVSVGDMLKDYNENYKYEQRDGALYLGWKKRALATFSTWR